MAGFSQLDKSIRAMATYPKAWQDMYMAKGMHRHDPVLRAALHAQGAIDWAAMPVAQAERDIMDHAARFAIGPSGVSVAVHGPDGDVSVLSVSSKRACAEWAQHRAAIIGPLQDYAGWLHLALREGGYLRPLGKAWPGFAARGTLDGALHAALPQDKRAPAAAIATLVRSGPPSHAACPVLAQYLQLRAAPQAACGPVAGPGPSPLYVLARDKNGACAGGLSLVQSSARAMTDLDNAGGRALAGMPRAPWLWDGTDLVLAANLSFPPHAVLRALVRAACSEAQASGVAAILFAAEPALLASLRAAGCVCDDMLVPIAQKQGASRQALVLPCAQVLRAIPAGTQHSPEGAAPGMANVAASALPLPEIVYLPDTEPQPPSRAELTEYCLSQIAAAQDGPGLDAALRLAEAVLTRPPAAMPARKDAQGRS